MKFMVFFLLVACMQVAAKGYSQKISLRVTNTPLEKVLREIEKQAGAPFFYDRKVIQKAAPITLTLNGVSLEQALNECLRQESLLYKNINGTIVIRSRQPMLTLSSLTVPDRVVTGKVFDDNGKPLGGVSVNVKGTGIGTVTSEDGSYSLKIPDDARTLEYSFLGFAVEDVLIDGRNSIDVQLRRSTADMDEVVVVGLNNKQTKRSIVGAVATIQTKELKQSPVANLSNALAGRLPGLFTVQSSGQPGSDGAAMFIRGLSTYGPNKAPLVVIDGLPRANGNFQQIDANEIESVSILKDASSTALYGIQGANGVIVVTTKRGKSGKPSINFTAQTALQQPVRLPQLMSSYENAVYENTIARNDGEAIKWTDDQLQKFKDGSDPYQYPDVNWFRTMLRDNAWQQQYNLNVSGGGPQVKYFVSGSYIKQGTLLQHEDDNIFGVKSKFDRYNFRSNVDLKLTNMLDVQVDLAGRLEERVGPGSGFESVFSNINAIGTMGSTMLNPNGTIAAGGVKQLTASNPYALVTRSGYYNEYTNVMYGTLSARHKLDLITPGLSIQGMFSFENNNFKGTYRRANYDAFWYKGLDGNGEPQYQQQTTRSSLSTSGSANISRYNYTDLRINYDRSFGQHNVSGQILANRTLTVTNDELPYAYQGVSTRFLYNFDRRYFVEMNMGYNGSENFPEDKRYGLFPAVSAGWIISDEAFLQSVGVIDMLKVRGSYGLVGNDKIGSARWLYLSDYASGGNYYFGVNPQNGGGFNESRIGNPNVTWEKSAKANIGIDASFFNNSLQITYDLFREVRSDILTAPGTIPSYVGVNNVSPRNTGEVLNRGMEVEVRYNKKFGNFRFFTTAQVTYAKNKIRAYDQPLPQYPYQNLVGYEIGASLGYNSLGYFQSQKDIENSAIQDFGVALMPGDIKYQDVNGDGVIDPSDRIPIVANNVPPLMFGFSIGGSWKGLDVSLLFNGTDGGISYIGPGVSSVIYREAWTPENAATAKAPVLHSTGNTWQPSNFWFQSSDYIKLRNAEIGYTLPSGYLQRYKIGYVRFFLNGQNLAIWDKIIVKDRDPEATDGGNVRYPIQRIINFGLNIQF
ncbi:MAG: TonB-dependent receptor [Candidatus Pseudobacter hemicellulosilyticus]|uniref:TonB-dependent receptor n=1 Tax=Candidatus Pseudobacter hemicellulosilyticus TaxID=3121375 RepID=A0AAJ5X0I9_9BACT|nr:MAG: TonB-dependent receptor [Pseudobacter sp.]